MTDKYTINEAIAWNKAQLEKAKDPRDQERYRENIRKLEAYRDDDNA